MDANSIRVYAPTPIMLLCGGTLNVDPNNIPSMREALTRVFGKPPFNGYTMLLAEQVNAFFPDGDYADLLSFEADIAQICELVIVFSESFGSAAELGAFVMYDEIAKKLLVVVDDKHYADKSFITLGPLRFLEKNYTGDPVCVLNRNDLGISNINNLNSMNIPIFTERMANAVKTRGSDSRKHFSLDPTRPGHMVKIMVGLIQHYGALYIEEIELFVERFGIKVDRKRLTDLLLCAELVEWIIKEKRGTKTYYVARGGRDAFSYKFKAGIDVINKERWRTSIVEFWEATDPDRFSTIMAAIGRSK